jgi:Ca-activated chloride channel family protein
MLRWLPRADRGGAGFSRPVLLIAAAVLLSAAFAQQPSPPPAYPSNPEPIRVNVRLVPVVATVKDPAGALVGSLEKADFSIRDNGIPQEIAVFERRTEQTLSVALLIDNSGSTAKDLKYEVDSVARFLHALFREGNPEDTVGLFSFNYEIVRQHPFSRNTVSMEHSLRGLKGDAGTALYDAIYLAAGELQHRKGRRAIVIVTDGGDTVSNKDFHAALEAAQLTDSVIYPILVVPIENDAGRNIGGENALTGLARGTGGRVFVPSLGAAMDRAFDQIIRELRTQYFLAFYPQNVPLTKDRFHRLEVQVSRPQLQVLSRSGYYGDARQDGGGPGDRISITPQSLPPPPAPKKKQDSKDSKGR